MSSGLSRIATHAFTFSSDFDIFSRGVLKRHDLCAHLRNKSVRNGENIAVYVIETGGNVPRNFKMLLLSAQPHQIGLVKKNIGSHKRRICKETRINIVCVLGRLVLKLSHSGQLSELGIAGKNPRKLTMSRNMRLYKQQTFFGIDAHRDKQSVGFKNLLSESGRLLPYSNGMKIGNRVNAVIFFLELDPISQR